MPERLLAMSSDIIDASPLWIVPLDVASPTAQPLRAVQTIQWLSEEVTNARHKRILLLSLVPVLDGSLVQQVERGILYDGGCLILILYRVSSSHPCVCNGCYRRVSPQLFDDRTACTSLSSASTLSSGSSLSSGSTLLSASTLSSARISLSSSPETLLHVLLLKPHSDIVYSLERSISGDANSSLEGATMKAMEHAHHCVRSYMELLRGKPGVVRWT